MNDAKELLGRRICLPCVATSYAKLGEARACTVNIFTPSKEQKIPALKGRQTITVGKAHCSRSSEKQKALQGRKIFYFAGKIRFIRAITQISDSDNVEARGTLRALKKRALKRAGKHARPLGRRICLPCVATSYANPGSSSIHREYLAPF